MTKMTMEFVKTVLGAPCRFAMVQESPGRVDKNFAKRAGQDGLAEVELAKLAKARAANAEVKKFAQRMVRDHSKANKELMEIAAEQNIALPSSPDGHHKQMISELQGLSGEEFDRRYIEMELADHEQQIKMCQHEASSGHDAALKSYAEKQVPILQHHLQSVRDIASHMGISAA